MKHQRTDMQSQDSKKYTLRNIDDQIQTLVNRINLAQDLGDAEAETLCMDELVKLTDNKGEKVDRYIGFIKSQELEIALIDTELKFVADELKRLDATKNRYEKNIERVKQAALFAMKVAGDEKIFGSTGKFLAVSRSESVNVLDLLKIDQKYLKLSESVSVDKNLVKSDIKAGIEVQGCEILVKESIRLG